MQTIGQNFYRLQAESQPKKCFKPDKGSDKRPPPPYNFFSKILWIKQLGKKCLNNGEECFMIKFYLKIFFWFYICEWINKRVMQLMAKNVWCKMLQVFVDFVGECLKMVKKVA